MARSSVYTLRKIQEKLDTPAYVTLFKPPRPFGSLRNVRSATYKFTYEKNRQLFIKVFMPGGGKMKVVRNDQFYHINKRMKCKR